MPTAAPKYDTDGSWKFQQYDSETWDKLTLTLQTALRPFYPDKHAETDPIFGHPADGWANNLLYEAYGAVSTMHWHGLRLSNEELRAEQKDVVSRLTKAAKCLDTMSHDLNIMLGIDADVLGCRDKILEIIPLVAAADTVISSLPKAKRRRETPTTRASNRCRPNLPRLSRTCASMGSCSRLWCGAWTMVTFGFVLVHGDFARRSN